MFHSKLPSSLLDRRLSAWALPVLALLSVIPLHAALTINEFAAANQSGLLDSDGQVSDWIEIQNDGGTAVPLLGYYLTDNPGLPSKWAFPNVTIAANGYLVVFASGKNRAVAGSELHTNFSLNESGEYLALVLPDGQTVVDAYAPVFPNQYTDVSYGRGTGGALETRTLFTQGSDSRWFVPLAAGAEDWRVPAFDDSGWTMSPLPLGYGYGPPIVTLGGNLDSAMRNKNGSAYIRIPFEISNPAEVVTLTLSLRHEDGFVAYLNGQVVAMDRAPVSPAFDSLAVIPQGEPSGEVRLGDPFVFHPLDFAGKLVAGLNILSFQLLNDSKGSSDVLLEPEMKGEFQDVSGGLLNGFFDVPTPGAPNGILKLARPATVAFSPATQCFVGTMQVALSVATPGAVIRYTTNGTVPTDDPLAPSLIYSVPLTISATTQLRAKAFLGGALEAKSRTEAYFRLTTDAAAATSNLPMILLDSFGTGAPYESGDTNRRPMMMAIFEPKGEVNPRSSLLNPPDLVTRIGARKRGSSSAGWPKYAMSIESWGETNWVGNSIDPLGLGGENDWVLSSRYQFDLALFRNDFIYAISRQAGRYAAETRFTEVYNNVTGGDVGGADYFGVYSLMHKLDRDDDRIDIAGLDATITTEPDISGGYIFKKDRGDPGEPTFSVNGMGALVHVYPNGGSDPNKPDAYYITTAQKNWLVAYCNNVNSALTAANGINPTTGLHFSEYIDVDSFIDHMLLNTLTMNVDWGRLSAWFFKDRGGKLNGGPIWDFDRTMGCDNDGRASNPLVWDGSGDSSRSWYDSRYPWYGRVLGYSADGQAPPAVQSTRPAEFQRAVDRWFQLRKGPLSVANMHAVIDSMAAEISEAQARNFVRWTQYAPATNSPSYSGGVTGWPGEVAQLKGWLAARVAWIDSQFPAMPTFNLNGGVVSEGFEVVMTAPAGTIYYTTDGSDPRMPDGSISPAASAFAGAPVDTVTVGDGAACRYYFPTDGSLGLTWTGLPENFDDAPWQAGTNGLGFDSSDFLPEITTNLDSVMRNKEAGGYFRFPFEFSAADNINTITLGMKIDDGFVAYLNGTQVAMVRAPGTPAWNSTATGSVSDSVTAAAFVNYDLTPFKAQIRNGTNVLAFHAMNESIGSSDFFLKTRLTINHTVATDPVVLDETTYVRARSRNGAMWSAPNEVTFVIGSELASASNLVVSQIMYHPADPTAAEMTAGFLDADDFEYIELMNIGAMSLDLNGVRFSTGLTFDFTSSGVTTLAPGERVLVVKNLAAFQQRYGHGHDNAIAGIFANATGLNNGGEQLAIIDTGSAPIKDFSYNDTSPWPVAADGGGYALVLVNPTHGVASNWRVSVLPGGSPGSGDSMPFVGDPNADGDFDNLSAFAEHALGTNAMSSASGPGVIRSEAGPGGTMLVRFPRNLAADDALIVPEVSFDLATYSADPADIAFVSETPEGDGTASVVYGVIVPPGTDGAYVRLRITSR
jgi:hypothetical protein